MTARVRGTAIRPGVSKNGRLYTRENIANAYKRLTARLSDSAALPVVMRTHHAAGDDSSLIVGQITKASLNAEGGIDYEGVLEDTGHGKTIATLAKPKDGRKPALAAVSIYGWWMQEPSKQNLDGRAVETADDFEIDAIDFTHSPGVTGATVTAENHGRAFALSESHEAEISLTETGTAEVVEADKAPYGSVTYADPGYQKDGVKRYPINDPEHVRAAWSYINQTKNAAKYTPAQVRRIKTRIKTAAKKVGVKIQDSWLYTADPIEGAPVAESDGAGGSFCIQATNGPINVSISSYCIDPADLEVVGRAAMQAATDALAALDPDMDADIDLPGVEDEDMNAGDQMEATPEDGDKIRARLRRNNQMETANPEASATTVAETTATQVAQPEKEETVSETAATTEGAATEAAQVTENAPAAAPAAPVFDMKALAEAVVAIMDARDEAKAKTAPVEEATKTEETAPAVTETAAADSAQLREGLKDVVRELLAEGGLKAGRKGYALSEQTEAVSGEELFERRGELIFAAARENARLGH